MSQPELPTPDLTINCVGMLCPLPIIELGRQITSVRVGQVLVVVADDPAAAYDVKAWCRLRDQEYLGSAPESNSAVTAYAVRRTS